MGADPVVPSASNSERDDDGDDDQSDDLETVHENVLRNYPILTLRVLERLLQDSVHLALVHESPQAGQPRQPEQFCNAGTAASESFSNNLERNGGHNIDQERTLQIPLGNFLMVSNVLECLLVLILLKEGYSKKNKVSE